MLRKLSVTLLLAGCLLSTGLLRASLAAKFASAKEMSDYYALPTAEHLTLASLGYRDALADVLYANVRVSYGLHLSAERRFEYAGEYLDAITTLAPQFRDPYLFADTFLTLQSEAPTQQDYRWARTLLERGMSERAFDTKLWQVAGQYLAYLAPPHVPEDEREEWRLAGARALGRACELASLDDDVPYHCIAAAGLFNRAGERQAMIDMLTRTLAVTDNEDIRQRALGYLRVKVGESQMEQRQRRLEAFQELWRGDLPFVNKDLVLLLGPRPALARCAGQLEPVPGCDTSWSSWGARQSGSNLFGATLNSSSRAP